MQGCTSIIISHRVSSLKLADKIVVLDNGKMVESGTYETLLKLPQGKFRELFEKQSEKESA
jgi:ATP-binding cassette subfamily B protein